MIAMRDSIIIQLTRDAPAVDKFAARELAEALKKMTGNVVPVRRAGQALPAGSLRLIIGQAAARTGPGRAPAEDEVLIQRQDQRTLALRGGGPRGNLYAVYEWLERLGCRWYHPAETFIPRKKNIELPERIFAAPAFEYRESACGTPQADPVWACRNRYNGSLHKIGAWGGGTRQWDPYVHSFSLIVPPEKYAQTHPEYFSLRHGQGRMFKRSQLCLSNPEVLRLAVEFALRKMEQPGVRIVDISQNDCGNPCQCARCEQSVKRFGGRGGEMLAFANKVAEQTARQHPDKYVAMLAYTYTQAPPKNLHARANVIVRLCHMYPSCDVHPLAGCKHNREYVRDLEGWLRIAGRVYVWHYITNFFHNLMFHPNCDALAADVRFYRAAGVKGIFFQGNPQHGVAFDALHAYVNARLAWNAGRDFWGETAGFLNAYYGAGGAHVLKFIEVMHANTRRGAHGHLYSHPAEGLFTRRQFCAAQDCLQKAFRAIEGDRTRSRRLEFVQLWLNYTKLMTATLVKSKNGFRVATVPGAGKLLKHCRRSMDALKITVLRERGELFTGNYLEERAGWGRKARAIRTIAIENAALKAEIAPEFAGMIFTLQDRATGINLFAGPATWVRRYPYNAGYTEGIEWDYGPGFRLPYKPEQKNSSGRALVLSARLSTALSVQRTISLEANTLRVESRYTNRGDKTAEVQPISSLMLSMGDFGQIGFFRFNAAGQVEEILNRFPEEGTVAYWEWVILRNAWIPAGKWGCFNRARGIGLLEDFSGQSAVVCKSGAWLREQRFEINTTLAREKIRPGGQALFSRRYTVIHEKPLSPLTA